jgi:hypothetical protein
VDVNNALSTKSTIEEVLLSVYTELLIYISVMKLLLHTVEQLNSATNHNTPRIFNWQYSYKSTTKLGQTATFDLCNGEVLCFLCGTD